MSDDTKAALERHMSDHEAQGVPMPCVGGCYFPGEGVEL